MADNLFTKDEAAASIKAVSEMFEAIPKSKQMDYIGHFNDVLLFISAASKAIPDA